MPFINCADAGLATYTPSPQKPWNRKRAMHLFRRIGMGVPTAIINEALTNPNPQMIIDQIIDDAYNLPPTEQPEWAFWTLDDYDPDPVVRDSQIIDQILTWATVWARDVKDNVLRDKMSFFWHNHFVTKLDEYNCPSYMYQYQHLLQLHALGNFKDFVHAMGLTPAMLIFLNGLQNTKFDPNENYARELYELFTLGLDNGYTQTDITETAKALTGWNSLPALCGPIVFTPLSFDDIPKTIFGQTGNWNYDDVIDILFDQRAVEISEHICKKLYAHFVNPSIDEIIISELATIFRNSNFEIRPVLEALFKSEHFFDEAHFSTVIPGPFEFFLTLSNELTLEIEDGLLLNLVYLAGESGQRVFNPIDVAGWPGNRNWINTNSINSRWVNASYFIFNQHNNVDPLVFTTIALLLCDESETDPAVVTANIVNHFLPKGLQTTADYERMTNIFKYEIPENYYTTGAWNLNWDTVPTQVAVLIYNICLIPEFQLK